MGCKCSDPESSNQNLANALEACNVSDDAIKKHCDLVWAQAEHGDDPEYHKAFDTMPTFTAELKTLQNGTSLKHAIAGKTFWSSLTTAFQVELINHDRILSGGKITMAHCCRNVF